LIALAARAEILGLLTVITASALAYCAIQRIRGSKPAPTPMAW
jgi:hypothetical protein